MPRFKRHKLLLDEGLPSRIKLPRVNSRHDIKHIKEDLGQSGISDEKVYKEAVKTKRLLIVFNVKHFRDLAGKSKNSGIIGISQKLPTDQIDKKLNALLSKSRAGKLYGRFTYINCMEGLLISAERPILE